MATDRHQAASYPLRMPDELKAKVQAAAEEGGRSIHAELLQRIQRSFETEEADQQSTMLREMRRTQLHLEMNTIRQEMGQLFAQGQELRARAKETSDKAVLAELEKGMDQIRDRKKDLDGRGAVVLARLAELSAMQESPKS